MRVCTETTVKAGREYVGALHMSQAAPYTVNALATGARRAGCSHTRHYPIPFGGLPIPLKKPAGRFFPLYHPTFLTYTRFRRYALAILATQ
jgi:hypothetical protein